ncbi:glycosyltransferase family 2 protein, partial [Acidithiobacillus caldus]
DSKEEETLEWLRVIEKKYANVRVLSFNYPFNYSAINNYGARNAKGSIIGLINNDIEVISPGWLTEMVSHCVRDGVGCVGAKLYYSNDTVQHGGVILGLGGLAAHSHRQSPRSSPGYFGRLTAVQNLSAVTGAVLLVRKEIFDEVGGLDEENLAIAYNDVDFCLKVRQAGYRIVWTPHAELYHHESISRGLEDTPEKKERFRKEFEFMIKKWGDQLRSDPFYNPNLTHRKEDFSLNDEEYV